MNDATPRVFVTKFQRGWDFENATEFGEVKFLTEREVNYEPTMPTGTDSIMAEIANGLIGYVPGKDFILLTASAVNNIIASHYVLSKPGTHQFLRWNSNRNNPKDAGYRIYRLRSNR
jgi:hypothetical protein